MPGSLESQPCPCCGARNWRDLISFKNVARSGRYGSKTDRPSTLSLSFEHCGTCAYTRQSAEIGDIVDYTHVDRPTARQLPEYAKDIIDKMHSLGCGPASRLLEVGSNDGTFLRELRDRGHTQLKGYEPSHALADFAAADGFDITCAYFDQTAAKALVAQAGAYDGLVCRHTLEHVPDPKGFVEAMWEALRPGGICMIEVPDHSWVLEQAFVHELWDEHLSFFTPGNLGALMHAVGFDLVEVKAQRFRDTRNILAFGRKSVKRSTVTTFTDEPAVALADTLSSRWQDMSAGWRATLDSAAKPVVFIGASHIQINFMMFAGLDNNVDVMIDDDEVKQGLFAQGRSLVPVANTDLALKLMRGGTVVRTGFPYTGWMNKVCAALSANGAAVVDPYGKDPAEIR